MHTDLVEVADHIVGTYEAMPGLGFAILTGSVARGIADAASDLDIYLFWDVLDVTALTESARAERVIGERLLGFPTESGVFEKYRYGDRLIDVESVTIATLAAVERELGCRQPMSPLAAKTIAGLRDAMPIRGADALESWRARLAYSPEQALVEIGANLRRLLPPRTIAELTLERGDAVSFAARLSTVALAAIGVVAALNRYALPLRDPKWLPWHVAQFERKPPDFLPRLQAVFAQPNERELAGFAAALSDTLDFVEAEIPAARPEVLRARFVLAFPPDARKR